MAATTAGPSPPSQYAVATAPNSVTSGRELPIKGSRSQRSPTAATTTTRAKAYERKGLRTRRGPRDFGSAASCIHAIKRSASGKARWAEFIRAGRRFSPGLRESRTRGDPARRGFRSRSEFSPAHHMKVQVPHGLKAPGGRIEAIALHAVFLREMARHQENIREIRLVVRGDLSHRVDVLLWDG